MGRIFGTDGIRGRAGGFLTAQMAFNLGVAGATVLAKSYKGEPGTKPEVLIGMDTRISSDMLAAALAAGICSVGADVQLAGVVPTPAVATWYANMDLRPVLWFLHRTMLLVIMG